MRLGGDRNLVAPASKCAAEDLLGGFTVSSSRGARAIEDRHVAIHVGSVNEVDTEVERCADNAVRVLRVRRDPERGSSEATPRDLDASRTED